MSKPQTASFNVGRARSSRSKGDWDSVTYPGHFTWPRLRVNREVQWRDPQNQSWNEYLNELGHENKGMGHARVLGEMACTLIADVEMRSIILDNRPQLKDDIKKARQYYHSLGRHMAQYIAGNGRLQKEIVRDWDCGARYGGSGKHEVPVDLGSRWNDMVVDTERLDYYGERKIGINLEKVDELRDERRILLNFLKKDEHLAITQADKKWQPHVVLFEVLEGRPVDSVHLRETSVNMPPNLLLNMPQINQC